MLNPILSELIAREQYKDRLRQAEQHRLAEVAIARQSANHFNLRTYLGNLLIAVRQRFKALACRVVHIDLRRKPSPGLLCVEDDKATTNGM
jgi:hypothetical protein